MIVVGILMIRKSGKRHGDALQTGLEGGER
jgi:hypothetical protein